jgi:hypothetical protein
MSRDAARRMTCGPSREDPGPVAVNHAFDHLPVITERAALAVLRRQQRLDPTPQLIREHRSTTHPLIVDRPSSQMGDTP